MPLGNGVVRRGKLELRARLVLRGGMGHMLNWYTGWGMLLSAVATGGGVGWFFWREDVMGGYGSWRRRLTRLGHIALAALGFLNMVYALSPLPAAGTWQGQGASVCLVVGGLAMPA